MDAMSAENALFSEITTQMQVNRNSLVNGSIISGELIHRAVYLKGVANEIPKNAPRRT